MTVSGSNFGTAARYEPTGSVLSDYGGGACVSTAFRSDTSLLCQVQGGLGVGLSFTVAVAGSTGTITQAFCYDGPILINAIASNGRRIVPATGGAGVTVFGRNFGTSDFSNKLRMGDTACQSTVWKADSQMVCMTPAGVGIDNAMVASVAGRMATFTEAVSYDRPSLSSLYALNSPASGGVILTVLGANFGSYRNSQSVQVGALSAGAVTWTSDSSMSCKMPAARGVEQAASVSQGPNALAGTLLAAMTYDDPLVTAMTPSNGPQSGGTAVTFHGVSFGTSNGNPTIMVGSACRFNSWISDTSATCTTQAGYGKPTSTVDFSTTGCTAHGGVCRGVATGLFAYDGPHPEGLTGALNAPSVGGGSITVSGTLFGAADPGSDITVLIGATTVTTVWVSDTSLKAAVPAGVGTRDVTVALAGAANTLSAAFSYDKGEFAGLGPLNGPAAGGSTVTLQGSNFGKVPGLEVPTVMIGDTSAMGTWQSDSLVLYAVPPGVKAAAPGATVVVRQPGATNGNMYPNTYFTYDTGRISSVVPRVANTLGDTTVTVEGKNFGGTDSTPAAFIGETFSCAETTWVSDATVLCKTPPLNEGSYAVSLLSGVAGSNALDLKAALTTRELADQLPEALGVVQLPTVPVLAVDKSAVSEDKPVSMKLEGGTSVSVPKGGFVGAGSVTVMIISAPASIASEEGQTATPASDIVVLKLDGVTLTQDIALSLPVDLTALAGRRAGPGGTTHLGRGLLAAASAASAASADAESGGAGGPQRRLLQYGGLLLKGAWLNKCTGAWVPICNSSVATATGTLEASVPPAVVQDRCYAPASGCATGVDCSGGGQIMAIGYSKDPCPAAPSLEWTPIIIGIVAASLVLCAALYFFWRWATVGKDDDDDSYYYSDEDEGKEMQLQPYKGGMLPDASLFSNAPLEYPSFASVGPGPVFPQSQHYFPGSPRSPQQQMMQVRVTPSPRPTLPPDAQAAMLHAPCVCCCSCHAPPPPPCPSAKVVFSGLQYPPSYPQQYGAQGFAGSPSFGPQMSPNYGPQGFQQPGFGGFGGM